MVYPQLRYDAYLVHCGSLCMYFVLIFLHFRSLILLNLTLEDDVLYEKEHKRELGDPGLILAS